MGWDIWKEAVDNLHVELQYEYNKDIKCSQCGESFTKEDYINDNIKTAVSNHTTVLDETKQVLDDSSYITSIRLLSRHDDCPSEEDEEEEDEE